MTQYTPPTPEELPPAPPRAVRVTLPASVPYMTYALIGITTAVYLLQLASQSLLGTDLPAALGAKANDLIRAGQLWRLVTPVLLHASIPHILFNMYALWLFGVGLERHFGRWRFLVLYALGGFTGNVLSFLLSSGLSVGASTSIFGLVAAECIFLLQNRQLFSNQFGRAIGNVVFVVAVNLALGAVTPGIDNWGHVGGLLGGLIFTWFAGPLWEVRETVEAGNTVPALRLVDGPEPRQVITGAAEVLLIFGAIAVIGIVHTITP